MITVMFTMNNKECSLTIHKANLEVFQATLKINGGVYKGYRYV